MFSFGKIFFGNSGSTLASVVFILFSNIVFSQDNYFQQEVDYKIKVSLNDKTHELSAFEEIKYINNSPKPLTFIYFHLWPNAYKNHTTALAKQLLEEGNTKFYFSKPEERGFIDSLDFKVNGMPVKCELDETKIDICKLILNEPLASGGIINITTPFHVKLPDAKFSRIGHSEQAYYITQWYPKPAVLDLSGWHQMPYLNQGEFYSEFGSFDVSITLPKNYLLSATGDRIDANDEEAWLEDKVKETENLIKENKLTSHKSVFPPSSSETKTIRFVQNNVHDFAWFADKRFHVLKDKVKLINSEKEIDTWVFFTDNEAALWKKSLEYINDATLFYSYQLGDYPYKHVTAIDGTIAAGGGMEYPNITVIGESGNDFTLETTIMHEVGHNWFYGLLGSNEREFPAMDEGLNSFYEMRYIRQKYPEKKLTALFGKDSTFKLFGLNKFKHDGYYRLAYLLAARKNTDQPINTNAADFTEYNYGSIVYCKTAIVFDYLMNSVGNDKFDEAMHFYFDHWKYKHPTPNDLQKTLEYYCSTDLNWFIDGLIMSKNKLDYKILEHKELPDKSHLIRVENRGKVLGPITLSGYKKGKMVGQVWYNGFIWKQVLEFPPSEADVFKIDGAGIMPEVNKQNNYIKTKGLFKKLEPLQLNLFLKMDDPTRTQLNYLPILGGNVYNGFMLGCSFYNYSFLQKKFEFTLAPMYAFKSSTPVGFADFQFNITPNKLFQQITVGSKFKSFAEDFIEKNKMYPGFSGSNPSDFAFNYFKIEPFIRFDLKKKFPRSRVSQFISMRNVNIWKEEDVTDYSSVYFTGAPVDAPSSPVKKMNYNYINELAYSLENARAINPFNLKLNFQQNNEFGKLSLTFDYSITLKNKYSVDFRFFAGTFLYGDGVNQGKYRFRASGFTGYQDYMYDYNFAGRNEYNGLGFSQFAEQDGALKTWTPLGQSDTWMAGLNIKSPKFFKLPVKLFADVVISDGQFLNEEKVLYDFGIEICLWKDIMEMYIPLIYNKDIKTTFILNGKNTFPETIRFTFNINKINPREFLSKNLF